MDLGTLQTLYSPAAALALCAFISVFPLKKSALTAGIVFLPVTAAATYLSLMKSGGGTQLWRCDMGSALINIMVGGAISAQLLISSEEDKPARYTASLLLAAAGLMLLGQASDLMALFLSTLIVSAGTALADLGKKNRSIGFNEFYVSAFCAAIFIYGTSLIFGATGTVQTAGLAEAKVLYHSIYVAGYTLILLSLALPAGILPFNFWAKKILFREEPPPLILYTVTHTCYALCLAGLIIRVPAPAGLPIALIIAIAASVSAIAAGSALLFCKDTREAILLLCSANSSLIIAAATAGTTAALDISIVTALIFSAGASGLWAFAKAAAKPDGNYSIKETGGLAFKEQPSSWCTLILLASLAALPPTAGFFTRFSMASLLGGTGVTGWTAYVFLAAAIPQAVFCVRNIAIIFRQGDRLFVAFSKTSVAVIIAAAIVIILGGFIPDTILDLLRPAS